MNCGQHNDLRWLEISNFEVGFVAGRCLDSRSCDFVAPTVDVVKLEFGNRSSNDNDEQNEFSAEHTTQDSDQASTVYTETSAFRIIVSQRTLIKFIKGKPACPAQCNRDRVRQEI